MIEIGLVPSSVAAGVSRIVTVRFVNPGVGTCTNVVVGLTLPPSLRLERGRTRFVLPRLGPGEVHEHALCVRTARPGMITIEVSNLSYRTGTGETRRVRGHALRLVAKVATECELKDGPVGGSDESSEKPKPVGRSSIFLSYRRCDTHQLVPGLVRALEGRREVRGVQFFLDLADIGTGAEWSRVLDRELGNCALLVAVIGREWLVATDDDGQRRLDDPADVVRHEIRAALDRDIPVVPVLVATRMPAPAQLPADIRELATRQAFVFDLDRYAPSVKRLADDLRGLLST